MNQTKYFTGVTTVEELRKRYRELLKQYHPDNPSGSIEITQQINTEYDVLFADLSKSDNESNKSYTYEENEHFKAVMNEIIGYNITIEIIGNWVWCFDCYSVREQLKTLGFNWCPKKKAWVWHEEPYKRYHKKEVPLSDIRAKYGSQMVKSQSFQYSLN